GGLGDIEAALGVDEDVDVGVPGARVGDLSRVETGVDRAVALPQDDLAAAELGLAEAAVRPLGIPDDTGVEVDAHLDGGVAAEVLVWEEEDAPAVAEGPLDDALSGRGGAD